MAGVSFYISGHGFGHASRQIEIINALGEASPSTTILIRTSAPDQAAAMQDEAERERELEDSFV